MDSKQMHQPLKVKNKGFSLVELLIGMTITMIVVGAFINLIINQSNAYNDESLRQEMFLTGRIALDEIQREAMNAGTGLPGLFSSVQIMNGSAGEPDTVTFIYIPPVNISLELQKSPAAAAQNFFMTTDSDINDLVLGDHLIIWDETFFNIIELTQITVSNGKVNFVPPVGVNTPDGLAHAYDPPTTHIARVAVYSITVDNDTDPDHPFLTKFRGNYPLGTIAYDIEDLQATIIFADGDTASVANDTDADDTNDAMDLRGVLVTVTARSSRPVEDYQLSADHYYRQEFTSTVSPRNIIY